MNSKRSERTTAIITAVFILLLGIAAILAAVPHAVGQTVAAQAREKRRITYIVKLLEVTVSDTRILTESKANVAEGEKATIIQGTNIPWKKPDGETILLKDSLELELTPTIVEGQGIRIVVKIARSAPNLKTGETVVDLVQEEALCGNLESLTIELWEKEDKSSRLAVQIVPFIEPRKYAEPQPEKK